MTATKQKQTLTAPDQGSVIQIKGAGEHRVAGPCDDSKNGRWYCVTHGEGFDNQLQKDIHINSGKHSLVWLCFAHGPEVDPKWFAAGQ